MPFFCRLFSKTNDDKTAEINDCPKDLPEIVKLSGRIRKYFNQVDILINNAGILIHKPFEELVHADFNNIFNINFFSPAFLIREMIPLLRKSEIKHVVNIGSMGGFQGSVRFPGLSLYSASKAALANLTESLAAEYSNEGISFNCLAPGAVRTDMLAEAFPEYKAPVEPGDMGRYIRDFSMNAYKFMNGKVIPLSLSVP